MENSVEKSAGGLEIGRKTKSLDIRSLYKTVGGGGSGSKEVFYKGKRDEGDKTKRKRRSRKEVALSSFELPAGKKSRNGLVEESAVAQSVPGLEASDDQVSGLSQKLNGGGGLNGVSLNLDINGNGLCIPKRPRGYVGRNRFAGKASVKQSVSSSLTDGSANLKVGHEEVSRKPEPSELVVKSRVEQKEIQLDEAFRKPEHSGSKSKLKKVNGKEISGDDVSGKTEHSESKAKSKVELREKVEPSELVVKSRVEQKEIQLDEAFRKPEHSGSKSKLKKVNGKEISGDDVSGKTEHSESKAKSKVELRDKVEVSRKSGQKVESKVKAKGDRNQIQQNEVSGKLGPSEREISSVADKLSCRSGGKVVNPKVKRRKELLDDSKVNGRDKEPAAVSSSQSGKREGEGLIVNNGDASSIKRSNNRRKRKVPASGRGVESKKLELSVDNVISTCDVFQEDDEENLEQNAARMLSSRFDPSCTGFSSNSRSSASSSANGMPFLVSRTPKFGSQELGAGSESASADTASRILRPRKDHKGKGQSRKRRHFYEIIAKDLDAFWFLNRRIKVFWPLDESWYYGLVNDYDNERKLHHIKYDDRDEEWISLRNERFKLLLLPSEVPSKPKPKEPATEVYHQDTGSRNVDMKDETFLGSQMESEPIISWLGRSSLRVKSSSGSRKKQKTSLLGSEFVPAPSSNRAEDACGNGGMDLVESETSNPYLNATLRVGSADTEKKSEKSGLDSITSLKGGQSPVVYVRRRKKKTCGSLPETAPSQTRVGRSLRPSTKDSVSLECSCSNELPWSLNNSGMLELNVAFRVSEQLRFEVCVSLRPLLNYALGADIFWLVHNVLLLRYGIIITAWPTVQLEVLFVDNVVGLRFFLFEGCLKQAVALVFLVMALFCEPDKQGKWIDLQMPVTSVRFKLTCIEDFSKQQVFAYYSFSKLKRRNWLLIDSELRPHCLHFKQLPLPECTYDNVKLLEGGSKHLHMTSGKRFCEVTRKKSMLGVLRKSTHVNRRWSSSSSSSMQGTLPPFALSFGAAPTFFLSLHLKLLMERSITAISLQDNNSVCSLDCSGGTSLSAPDECIQVDDPSGESPESIPKSTLGAFSVAACSGLICSKLQQETQMDSVSIGGGLLESSLNLHNGKSTVTGTSISCKDPGITAVDILVNSDTFGGSDLYSEQFVPVQRTAILEEPASPVMSSARCFSNLNGMSVEIPACDQVDRDVESRQGTPQPQVSDLAWNLSDGIVCSPNPTAPRSLWPRNRFSPSSSSFGHISHAWPDGKTDFIRNGFGNGPRKPRTQVQYALPFGGPDFNSKHKFHNQNSHSYKRIRRANEKRTSDVTRGTRRNLELVACDANLLITHGDKGWRECGARVFLEGTEQNEWKLAVKLSGMTKYSHKVTQDLQPGSTNRFTHSMMWKGGKDWALEFPDRSQWVLFKEMHEECHNRNIRAASVKNIPIPGVHLIEDSDDYAAERPFLRSPKYFRQVETDVDMAMDPSHILYDMDSDDEEWIVKNRNYLQTQEGECEPISDELFEKTMDTFEKVSYAQQCDYFTVDEIEDLEAGPIEVMKAIYEHWRQKRQKKGMALIRQLQPPLWERYQQQVKEWEQLMGKHITTPSSASQEKARSAEKPPMFAFCLKPRGLEVPNRGSKHRPHKKYSISLNNHAAWDHDGPHSLGKRLNGAPFGDERGALASINHEASDVSPLLYGSARVFSPRDAVSPGYMSLNADASEWNHHPRFHWNNSKKIGTFSSLNNSKTTVPLFSQQRKTGKRNGVHQLNMPLPDWSSQGRLLPQSSYRHQIEQLGGPDLDEFKLRDASGAAKHALNMARLKRQRAQKLLYRADLAIHKAVSALMTAEAVKASYDNSNGDG